MELMSGAEDEGLCVDCLVASDVTCSEVWAKATAFHGTPMEDGPRSVISTRSSMKENLFFWTFCSFHWNLYIKTHSFTISFVSDPLSHIHPTRKYLLSTSYGAATILSYGDRVTNKTGPCSLKMFTFWWVNWTTTHPTDRSSQQIRPGINMVKRTEEKERKSIFRKAKMQLYFCIGLVLVI